MNETINDTVLTLTEIEKQFDGEWVLLEDPYDDDRKRVAGGKLLAHSKNRDDVYAKAMELRPKHSAVLYMGPMPDNIWINLTSSTMAKSPSRSHKHTYHASPALSTRREKCAKIVR